MKKLMSLTLGLSIALGSFAAFAQDTPTSSTEQKKVKMKKNARKTVKKETSKTIEKQN